MSKLSPQQIQQLEFLLAEQRGANAAKEQITEQIKDIINAPTDLARRKRDLMLRMNLIKYLKVERDWKRIVEIADHVRMFAQEDAGLDN